MLWVIMGSARVARWALGSPSLAARAEAGTDMDTAASLAAGLTTTSVRGWLVRSMASGQHLAWSDALRAIRLRRSRESEVDD
jgi:hypothetical protein